MNKSLAVSRMKTPLKLATPSDLKEKGRQEIANAVNPLVADAFALYVKIKNFHWHLSGSHFRDYHRMLDEHADQVLAMVDVLAERLRKLGETTIRSIGHISRLQNVKDSDDIFLEPDEMIRQLMNDNKDYVERMREAHQVCEEHHDIATTSILEIFIDETEKRTWFLFETLAN